MFDIVCTDLQFVRDFIGILTLSNRSTSFNCKWTVLRRHLVALNSHFGLFSIKHSVYHTTRCNVVYWLLTVIHLIAYDT